MEEMLLRVGRKCSITAPHMCRKWSPLDKTQAGARTLCSGVYSRCGWIQVLRNPSPCAGWSLTLQMTERDVVELGREPRASVRDLPRSLA